MPEGPEVRHFAENINSIFAGKYLLRFWNENFSHFRNLEKLQLPSQLKRVYSRGKKIVFEFENGYLLSSLGLEGGWYLGDNGVEKASTLFKSLWGDRYKEDYFITKHLLFYDDTRHFGWLEYFSTSEELEKRCDIGIDLLDSVLKGEINFETWKKALLRGKKSPICITLMEQKYIAGIGNYLRSDILYDADIDPMKETGKLSDDELHNLYKSSIRLIVKAYQEGGADGSYENLFDTRGKYDCLVYGKKIAPCGNAVTTAKDKNGRTVWFVNQEYRNL